MMKRKAPEEEVKHVESDEDDEGSIGNVQVSCPVLIPERKLTIYRTWWMWTLTSSIPSRSTTTR